MVWTGYLPNIAKFLQAKLHLNKKIMPLNDQKALNHQQE
jgi:hypothetical protein